MSDYDESNWFHYEDNDYLSEFDDSSFGWQERADCDFCFRSKLFDEVCIACGHLYGCKDSSCCHNYEKEDETTVRHPDDCEVCYGCGCELKDYALLCPYCGHSDHCSSPDESCQEPRHCNCQDGNSRKFCALCKHDHSCELATDDCPDPAHCSCVSSDSRLCIECKHDVTCLRAEWFCEESTHEDDGTQFVKAWF